MRRAPRRRTMSSDAPTHLDAALPASRASSILPGPVDRDTELADRLLEQRLKASLFGATPRPPTLGPYRLDARLGAGGMGVVYRAHDPELGRDVALKVLHPDLIRGAERIRQEARSLARLAHPNIVAVFDAGEDDGRLFLAMELVAGETLRAWLERVRVAPQPRWRRWLAGPTGALRTLLERFLQAARGLQAAHAAGLVHCDFKPENVLVGSDGRVRVVDFGIASPVAVASGELEDTGELAATTRTLAGEIAGTPAYMAPEQLRGGPLDARADQFAFCVALYEALTGARPFPGETLAALIDAVQTRAPAPLPRWVPSRLRGAIARGLARAPDRRSPDMAALVDALERALAPRAWRSVAVATSAACVLTVTAVALVEPAAPPAPAPLDLQTWAQQRLPTLCLTTPSSGGEAEYRAQLEQRVAELAGALVGSREHLDAKTRLLALQLGRGDLTACKTAAMTLRGAPDMPWRNAAELRCLWARYCVAPADAACPPGLVAGGVGGCRPIASCPARGLPAQADACLAGQVECCRGALALTRYSLRSAGALDTEAGLAEQRALAEAGCDGGHAELCLEAAQHGMDGERARGRACELQHRSSCDRASAP